MDELALLKPKLARLKLSGMLDTLSERLSQALAEKWSYTQFLDILLTDEAERRDFKQLGRRLTKSGLAPDKTLETFDFSFNPRIHAPTLRELATCRFVQRSENVFFVGPSGVGKSHAAQALGHVACRKGYAVTYERTSVLLDWIHAGRGDGTYQRRLHQVGTVALLILDLSRPCDYPDARKRWSWAALWRRTLAAGHGAAGRDNHRPSRKASSRSGGRNRPTLVVGGVVRASARSLILMSACK